MKAKSTRKGFLPGAFLFPTSGTFIAGQASTRQTDLTT
jgi:hypothetical protein